MGANKIYLQVDFQDSEADAQIKKLNKEIAAVGETSEQATKKSEQSFKSFGVSIEETQRAVFGLGEAIAELAALQLAREMIEVADKINKVEIALETMTGSAEVAADTLRSIRDIAKTSPFAFEDLATGARRLAAFGLEASRIPADIKAISNAAAALGGSADMVEHLTQTIGMMYAKDDANSRFLFRGLLKEGLPVLAMVQAALKKSRGTVFTEDQIKEMIEHQGLAGRKLADALLEGMQERYKDSGKVMSLVSVNLTKLTDDVKELAEVVMHDLAPALNTWIMRLESLVKWFGELPGPMRRLIELTGELAAAASILGVAWKLLNGLLETTGILKLIEWLGELRGEIALVTATGGTMSEAFAGWAMAAVPASISIMGIVTALGYVGLAIGAFLATNKLIDWLEEVRVKAGGIENLPVPANIKLLIKLFTDEADKARLAGEELQHYALVTNARNQELRAQAMKVAPFAASTEALPQLPMVATKEGIDAMAAQNREFSRIILDAHKHLNDDLLKQNQAALEQLDQMTAAALDKARAKASGGIAAIDDELAEAYRKINAVAHPFTQPTATIDEDRARLAQARQLRIDQVIEAADKQSQATRRELAQKAAEDNIADMKKASDLEVELAKQTSSELSEARAVAQVQGYDVLLANEEKFRAASRAATQARQKDELDEYRSHLTAKDQMAAPEMLAQHEADIQAKYRVEQEKANLESYQREAKYRVDIERAVIEQTRQLNEEAFQLQNQNQIDRAQHLGELAKAAIDVIPAQTEEAKTAQAQAAAQAQIDALQRVYDLEQILRGASYDDDLRALNAQLEKKLILQQTYNDAVTAMTRKRDAQDIQDAQNLEFEKAKLQIEAMKKHNEAVIADQKQVYDQIKSGVDKVWDAMTSRAGTFAERIGNMLKAAFADAIKSIVTSHVSAALTEAFGKGHVGFGGGPLRQALGTQPIFGADKMQNADIWGANTVSAGGAKSLLVTMTNPPAPDLTQNIHVSSPAGVSGSRVAAAVGAAALLGAAAASGSGGGTPFVTSSINFGGGGSFGAGGGSFGGGGGGTPFGAMSAVSSGLGADTSFGTPAPPGFDALSQMASLGAVGGTNPNFGGGPVPGLGALSQMASLTSPGGFASAATKLSALGSLSKILGIGSGGGGGAVNLLPGSILPGLGVAAGIAGLGAARQLGTHGAGGLVGGAVLGAASGALTFSALAALFPVLIAAGPIGLIAAAGVGAAIGLSTLFFKTADQKVRSKVKQVYGVDISEANVRMQIVQIAKDRYGGNLDVAIASPEVQDIVRLYSIATGKNPSGLPRPMYAANFTESGAGGVNLQPVYQGGNVVANPYSGVTTTQYAQLGSQLTYLSLDPTQALSLLSGQVTGVMAQNPGNVAAANAAALASGNSRDAQNNALFEPLTVMS